MEKYLDYILFRLYIARLFTQLMSNSVLLFTRKTMQYCPFMKTLY
jgi:hypothetical protein